VTGPAEEPRETGGRGPLVIMLVAFGVMCVGSVGAAGYFAWRAAENAAERAEERRLDEQHQQNPVKEQPK
jgi:hypothetical protein